MTTLSKLLSDITKSDIIRINNKLKVATIVNLVEASLISGIRLSSNQVIKLLLI